MTTINTHDQRPSRTTPSYYENDPERSPSYDRQRPTTNNQQPSRTTPIVLPERPRMISTLRSLTTNDQRPQPPKTIPSFYDQRLRTTTIVVQRLPRMTSQPPVRPLLMLGSTVQQLLRLLPLLLMLYYDRTIQNYCQ